MNLIKQEQFIWDFLKKETIPDGFESVSLNDITFYNNSTLANIHSSVTSVSLVPSYVTLNYKNKESFKELKINNTNLDGLGITINENDTLESYLQNTLSTQTRKNVQRFWNRLNQSFNIEIKYYYGEISKENYSFLIANLYNFLDKRFDDKQLINGYLINWDKKIEPVFDLINNKKASLFVIYNEETPINITLNYHAFNTILFAEMNGFDTNYYKFGMGHIDNYLLLKWCIDNNYKFLDLGNGTLDYKKKWCNTFYHLQYVLIYKKDNLLSKILFTKELSKIKIKNYLKKIKIDEFIFDIKHYLKSPKKTNKKANTDITFNIEDVSNINSFDLNNATIIDLNTTPFLIKPVYDSLFNSNEHINNITIYKVEDNTYVIKGSKSLLKLTFMSC